MIARNIDIQWLHINQYWEIFYALGMLVCINSVKKLQNIFNNCFVNKISNQSMTIYLLHWPLICSFSTWCFIMLMRKCNIFLIYYLITMGITIVILEIVVYCYDKVIGNCSNMILKRITLK